MRLHLEHANTAICVCQVINVAGWLRKSVRPEWTSLLPLSLVWLSYVVIYCLSPGCLMVDANWPPFPLSSTQMKRFLRRVMEHVTIWSDKLKSSLLSHCHHSKPPASSAIMMIFLHWRNCSALQNTILKRAGCCICAVCVTTECLWSVKSSILLFQYLGIFFSIESEV